MEYKITVGGQPADEKYHTIWNAIEKLECDKSTGYSMWIAVRNLDNRTARSMSQNFKYRHGHSSIREYVIESKVRPSELYGDMTSVLWIRKMSSDFLRTNQSKFAI